MKFNHAHLEQIDAELSRRDDEYSKIESKGQPSDRCLSLWPFVSLPLGLIDVVPGFFVISNATASQEISTSKSVKTSYVIPLQKIRNYQKNNQLIKTLIQNFKKNILSILEIFCDSSETFFKIFESRWIIWFPSSVSVWKIQYQTSPSRFLILCSSGHIVLFYKESLLLHWNTKALKTFFSQMWNDIFILIISYSTFL